MNSVVGIKFPPILLPCHTRIYDTEYPSINDFSELSGADKHVHFTYKSR